MIDTGIIALNSKRYKADHYVKRFTAKDHLISMLFCVFAKCSSLCEVMQKAVNSLSLAKRSDGELEFDYIKIFETPIDPNKLHFWIYLTSKDFSINSVSWYVNL